MSGSSQNSSLVNLDPSLSLYHLLEPDILANPYPLYHRLRTEDAVHWDSYLHAWVVTRYKDVVTVLQNFSAARTPTPEQLRGLGLSELEPVARVMMRQMLFRDAPAHTRLRSLAAAAFSPSKVEALRSHIQEVTDNLIDAVVAKGRMDVIADLADLLPATLTAELMGVPVEDRSQLKEWSKDFSEMLANFQHNPGRTPVMLKTVEQMTDYFRHRMCAEACSSREGVVQALMNAEVDGDRLTEEEVIANSIITLVGGLDPLLHKHPYQKFCCYFVAPVDSFIGVICCHVPSVAGSFLGAQSVRLQAPVLPVGTLVHLPTLWHVNLVIHSVLKGD